MATSTAITTEVSNLRRVPAPSTANFFRSAAPAGLGAGGLEQLAELGLHTIVDLREPFEAREHPDCLPSGVRHVAVPLYRGDLPFSTPLAQVYADLLSTRGAELAKAVGVIADALPDGVLVHCAAGKDRTGLVVALILEAVGVQRGTVLADYALSGQSLPDSYRVLKRAELQDAFLGVQQMESALELHLESPAAVLEAALEMVVGRYGGSAGYLLANGLSPAELGRLRVNLMGPTQAAVLGGQW